MRHACCFCGRYRDADGKFVGKPAPPDRLEATVRRQANEGVSHGCCPECKAKVLARAKS